MSQVRELVVTLKRELRRQGRTYADVAEVLGLSEPSVKRLFSRQEFSLERLDKVCTMLQLTLAELVRLMESEKQQLEQLTLEQEKELVSDSSLLLVAYLVINGYGFDDILVEFSFSENELIHLLAVLDRIRLIELQPGNRIRRLVSPHFHWRAGGPIQSFFIQNMKEEFLNSRFDGENEMYLFLPGMLSNSSQLQMYEKLTELARQFGQFNEQDQRLSPKQRKGYTLLLATRAWRPGLFNQHHK